MTAEATTGILRGSVRAVAEALLKGERRTLESGFHDVTPRLWRRC
jgi:hypothetical protein